ncbi:hypothetical protein EP7_005626 (plasmid) [Isosphaeraceae bacterium EP7]
MILAKRDAQASSVEVEAQLSFGKRLTDDRSRIDHKDACLFVVDPRDESVPMKPGEIPTTLVSKDDSLAWVLKSATPAELSALLEAGYVELARTLNQI